QARGVSAPAAYRPPPTTKEYEERNWFEGASPTVALSLFWADCAASVSRQVRARAPPTQKPAAAVEPETMPLEGDGDDEWMTTGSAPQPPSISVAAEPAAMSLDDEEQDKRET